MTDPEIAPVVPVEAGEPGEGDNPMPDPDEFPSYDDVDPEVAESELPDDSFDETVADFESEGEAE